MLLETLLDVVFDLDEWSRPWVAVSRGGLSYQHVVVLYLIRQRGATTISTLATRLAVTPMAISSAAKRLEDLAYIRRVTPEHDRRRLQLEITDLGRQVSEKIEAECMVGMDRHLGALTDEQVKRFLAATVAFDATLRDMLTERPPVCLTDTKSHL